MASTMNASKYRKIIYCLMLESCFHHAPIMLIERAPIMLIERHVRSQDPLTQPSRSWTMASSLLVLELLV